MGLFSPTQRRMYAQSARFKARMTCTTTPLRSLADPGGGFDVPKAKCPPDRSGGSPCCVTGRPASIISTSSNSSSNLSTGTSPQLSHSKFFPNAIVYPPTPPLASTDYSGFEFGGVRHFPVDIPTHRLPSAYSLPTPPATPEDDSLCGNGGGGGGGCAPKKKDDALDFLMTVFPRNGLVALRHAKSVAVSDPNLGTSFDGVVLDLPGSTRTLYVHGKSAQSVNLRESIVALLDLADERLECGALVIVLERSSPALGDVLHSLMYVGGQVVSKPPFDVASAYVLVGMEI